MESINPATGEVVEVFPESEPGQVRHVIEEVHTAWSMWRDVSLERRGALLRRLAGQLRADAEKLARMMAQEMGKPVRQGRGEIEKCAWVCEYYASRAPAMLAEQTVASEAAKSYVAFRPLGVILAVMPWNFPFWQVFRFAAPALMAGNVALLKHASNVPRCALAIEKLFALAGFPDNVFRTLMIGARGVDAVVEHRHIRAVTLTGSEPAGRKVAATAGRMLKKTVLELGGSDPFIVMPDADLDAAAGVGAQARCLNSGQSCIAAKRFIVFDEVHESFVDRLKAAMVRYAPGDPLEDGTLLGPLARGDLREELHTQVLRSVAAGARAILGGALPAGSGFFYPPTILTGVRPGMPAYDEELFGPVAAVIRVADIEEAVQVANDTPFGLGASVWSRDVARAEQLAARIEAGAVFVNELVKSDPRLPFGGIKDSGYGRELSDYGLREFVNIQTVWIG